MNTQSLRCYILSLLLLSICFSEVFGQSQTDSLKRILEGQDGTARILTLLDLMVTSRREKGIQVEYAYGRQAMELLPEGELPPKKEAQLYYNMGNILFNMEKVDSALIYLELLKKLEEETKLESIQAEKLELQGQYLQSLGQTEEALEIYKQALEVGQRVDDVHFKYRSCLTNLFSGENDSKPNQIPCEPISGSDFIPNK